jgi:hypothetical protein
LKGECVAQRESVIGKRAQVREPAGLTFNAFNGRWREDRPGGVRVFFLLLWKDPLWIPHQEREKPGRVVEEGRAGRRNSPRGTTQERQQCQIRRDELTLKES